MMKRLSLLIALICLINISQAQQQCPMMQGKKQGNGSQNKKHRLEKMAKMLQLTGDQKKQFKALQEETRNKMEALKNEQTITLKEFYNRQTALRKEMQAKKASILTKEQNDKIAQHKLDKENRRKEKFEQHMIHLKYGLGLSEEQLKQLQKWHQKNAEMVGKIKSDEAINDHDKRTKIKALRISNKEEMKKIFTADQMKKMEEMKEKKKSKKEKKKK